MEEMKQELVDKESTHNVECTLYSIQGKTKWSKPIIISEDLVFTDSWETIYSNMINTAVYGGIPVDYPFMYDLAKNGIYTKVAALALVFKFMSERIRESEYGVCNIEYRLVPHKVKVHVSELPMEDEAKIVSLEDY